MKYLIYFLLIFISIKAFAHQPKLIKHSPSMKNPYEVIYPEISKAYYGKLNRKSHYYRIISNKDFLFYAGILTPKVNENHKWISLDIIDENNNIIYQADGSKFNWEPWYEPYARDWYWKGPEIGGEINKETGFKKSFLIKSGTYIIKVYNNDNIGNYSLAVGEAEFFGSNTFEKILTWTPIIFYIGPYMDIVHWKKFDVTAYIPHIMLLVLFFLLYLIIKKIFFKRKDYV
tara:strand:- start:512 stop:1201 length:690 start_codon:yes stop_codon:yes gene_type:complete